MKRPVFTYLFLLIASFLVSGCSPDMISGPASRNSSSSGGPQGVQVTSEKIIGKYELNDVARLIYHVSSFSYDPRSSAPGVMRADIRLDHVRQELVVSSYQQRSNDANLRMICQFVAPNGAYEILVKGLRNSKLAKSSIDAVSLNSAMRTASFETRDGRIDTYPLPGSQGGDLGDEALFIPDETLKILTSYLGDACGSTTPGPIPSSDVTSLEYRTALGGPIMYASVSFDHKSQILYVNVTAYGYPIPMPHPSEGNGVKTSIAPPPGPACAYKVDSKNYRRMMNNLANIRIGTTVEIPSTDHIMPEQLSASLTINRIKYSSVHPFEHGINAILGPSDLRVHLDQLVSRCWAPY